RLDEVDGTSEAALVNGLKDKNPRVRNEAAFAVGRSGDVKAAEFVAELLGDADPTVAHTSMEALKVLKAYQPCFEILDRSSSISAKITGALHVLQLLHEPEVVEGLIARVSSEKDAGRRHGILTA